MNLRVAQVCTCSIIINYRNRKRSVKYAYIEEKQNWLQLSLTLTMSQRMRHAIFPFISNICPLT